MWLSIAIMLFVILDIMSVFPVDFITTDKQLLWGIFGGILFACLGVLFSSIAIEPRSRFQMEERRRGIIGMSIGSIGCLILIVMIFFI